MLEWAIDRSGLDGADLRQRFKKLDAWIAGDARPTIKQLQDFARATHTPIGYLFLPEPPEEALQVSDFRTVGSEPVERPSPDLLDTLQLCEVRQEWFRDYAVRYGSDSVDFVGSASVKSDPAAVAHAMQELLGFRHGERQRFSNWSDALRGLIDLVENVGVLVMVSGVVGSNTHRTLKVEEFRGLALSDDLAPLIFINGADTKAAQIFTLAHEFAHLWLGSSGVDRPALGSLRQGQVVEQWCNAVAAEFLVPLAAMPSTMPPGTLVEVLERLAREFKVSTLVILRRLVDRGLLAARDFPQAYRDELARVLAIAARRAGDSGGQFYYTQPLRVSQRFARAVISNTLEGETLYVDAFRLLGVRKAETLREFGVAVGVA